MKTLLLALLLLTGTEALAAGPPTADAPPEAVPEADVLAAAVRIRGYGCREPQAPVADVAQTQPDRPAWIVRCAEGRYRVVYEGDTGPRVTPLD